MNARVPSARKLAQLEGRVTYHGSTCKHCLTTEKYTKHGRCITCAKQNTRKRVANGDFKKYHYRAKSKRRGAPPSSTVTYLISEQGDTGFVKIGITTENQLSKRLAQLQTGNPRNLFIAGVIAGDCERELHQKFSHLRVAGEWFRLHWSITQHFQVYGTQAA